MTNIIIDIMRRIIGVITIIAGTYYVIGKLIFLVLLGRRGVNVGFLDKRIPGRLSTLYKNAPSRIRSSGLDWLCYSVPLSLFILVIGFITVFFLSVISW